MNHDGSLEQEIENLRRRVTQLERDNWILTVMNENADRLRKANEMELVTAREKAEAASLAKSQFLASMSHEIRTPMNAVKGLSELLSLTELNNIQKSYVHNIIRSANSLLTIINDILDFSRMDAGRTDLVLAPYFVGELITDVVSAVNLRALNPAISFYLYISPQIPSQLFGDDTRIRQIIVNILSNGIKYTKKGFVKLSIYMEQSEGESFLCVSVRDSGIGIHQKDIPHLFETFTRADVHNTRAIVGTGLGLSITKQLLNAMNGTINVESVYGQGSTFTARIPQEPASTQPIAFIERPEQYHILLRLDEGLNVTLGTMLTDLNISYDETISDDDVVYTHVILDTSLSSADKDYLRRRLPDSCFFVIQDMRSSVEDTNEDVELLFAPILITELCQALTNASSVEKMIKQTNVFSQLHLSNVLALVVDDNEINLLVISELLRALGVEVVMASGGAQALDLCHRSVFDIIFMDHIMPEMDGLEATKQIRSSDTVNRDVPIIALTANVISDNQSQYIEHGMNDFISKPIEMSVLIRILKQWISEEKYQHIE